MHAWAGGTNQVGIHVCYGQTKSKFSPSPVLGELGQNSKTLYTICTFFASEISKIFLTG